jgi:hypothetical protein
VAVPETKRRATIAKAAKDPVRAETLRILRVLVGSMVNYHSNPRMGTYIKIFVMALSE